MSVPQNVVNAIIIFINESFLMFQDFIEFVEDDTSGILITFVVAFPLLFFGVWIIKKLIRVKDS